LYGIIFLNFCLSFNNFLKKTFCGSKQNILLQLRLRKKNCAEIPSDAPTSIMLIYFSLNISFK
jgi:hypothetical protein